MSMIIKEPNLQLLLPLKQREAIIEEYAEPEIKFEVTGEGKLVITNTGGASASEGGMGTGSDDDREKGSLSKPGEKSGQASSDEDDDTTFDPLKKKCKKSKKKRG